MSDSAATAHVQDAYRALLRRALLAGGVVAVVCVVVAGVTSGAHGLFSAALGSAVVLVFFGARLLVMRRTAASNPQTVLVVALAVYTGKIVLLGIAMILLMRISWVVGPALGLSVIACAVGWLAAEMQAFVKLRIPVFGAAAEQSRDGRS